VLIGMNEPAATFDISQAIVVLLDRYPGKNYEEFERTFGHAVAPKALQSVRAILHEAMKVDVNWEGLSLSDGGDYVMSVISARHPELSAQALKSIGNYYTYLMR
jgi:hypothetical protein